MLTNDEAQKCDNVLLISPWMEDDHQCEIPPLEQTEKGDDEYFQ